MINIISDEPNPKNRKPGTNMNTQPSLYSTADTPIECPNFQGQDQCAIDGSDGACAYTHGTPDQLGDDSTRSLCLRIRRDKRAAQYLQNELATNPGTKRRAQNV